MTRLTAGTILCLILGVLAAPALAGDYIQKKPDGWLPTEPAGDLPGPLDFEKSTITVLSEDYDYVWYKFESVPNRQKLEADKVERVFYENPPQQFNEAADAMGAGDLPSAIEKFRSIVQARRAHRSWVVMYSLYNLGKIYQEGLGQMEQAVEAWRELEKQFPRSKYVPGAIVKTGLAHLAMGNRDEAERAFRRLQRLPDLAEDQRQIGRYWVIYIKQQSGAYEDALAEYRQLLEDVEADPDLKQVAIRARLGIGDCLLALKRFEEALSFFQKIADSSQDPAVLAGAFNGLGRCHFEQQNWKDALLSFLRTMILYDETPDQTAMALCYAADSYTYLRSEDWKDRAKSLFRECIARYPGSQWAQRARELLPKVR